MTSSPVPAPGDGRAKDADDALLARAKAGDRAALETLLENHQGQIYRFGKRMCRDDSDADDIVQETMLALARGIQDFRGEGSLSTWLFSVARSHCIKKRRKSKFAPSEIRSFDAPDSLEAKTLATPGDGPDEDLLRRELEGVIEKGLDALEPEYREVVLLRDVEGLSAAEVANILETTVATVKSRLHRARRALRDEIAPLLSTPEERRPPSAECPDILALFSEHLEGDVSPDTCREMELHLERCPRCSGVCASLKRTLSLCQHIPAATEVPESVRASLQALFREMSGNPGNGPLPA